MSLTKSKADNENIVGAHPDWDALFALASGQAGHFTSAQAASVGFSDQVLARHAATGRLERARRGIYRISHFPPAEHEDLVVAWLWSEQEGVISHETALQLHGLSDALPGRIHITLPLISAGRRRAVPEALVVHHADVGPADRTWIGPVPVTLPARSVRDVAGAYGDAALVEQAIEQGIRRKLFGVREVADAVMYINGCAP